ncbi:hypothetical protein J4U74_15570, partial [Escherichia coli]
PRPSLYIKLSFASGGSNVLKGPKQTVAKRGTYGLNTFSQARPYAHQSLCLHERENHRGLLFMYACLLGAMMCFMDTPVRTLS